MSPETRNCQNCKKDFAITPEEFSAYQKVGIELPVICFSCRVQQHFSFWPFGKFRKGTSALSGESFITVLSEHVKYPIYTLKEWHSDAWDPMVYGIAYDPNRSFFDQLVDLQVKVPRPHQTGTNNIGCDWCDDVWNSKNCYLSRSMEKGEDLYYAYRLFECKNCIDCVFCFKCDGCYDSRYCHNSYNLSYSRNSRDCMDSFFLYDCRNSTNCFMCTNLRGKQYCIGNKQFTREEYFEKLKEYNLSSYESVQKLKIEFEEMMKSEAVHRENFNLRELNSKGDFLIDTKNCQTCFMIHESEDSYNCVRGMKEVNCIDANCSWFIELSGNCSCCVDAYGLKYSLWSSGRFCEYVDQCVECEHCFGCVGLKKKKYCILNVQYTKEEYEILKEKIIEDMRARGEYGKFFPYSMATGPVNFSTAMIYVPETTKEDVERLGGPWEDPSENRTEGTPTSELPDRIGDVDESITKVPLICPVTGWRYNIAANELQFYKQKNIPLPREHFDVRIKQSLKHYTVLRAFPVACIYCAKDLEVYYLPEWGYKKIACESCYQREIN